MQPEVWGGERGEPGSAAPRGASLTDLAAAAFDSIPAAAAIIDRAGRIVDTNRTWRLFGVLNGAGDTAAAAGADYLAACDAGARSGATGAELVAAGLRDVLAGRRSYFEHEYPCDSPSQPRWFLLQAAPLADGRGIVVTHTDISRRKQLETRLQRLVDEDPLTGLATRPVINRALATVQDEGAAVLLCDLDGFKAVNDSAGHLAGDELLVQLAARLRHVAGDGLAGRLGGDEFVIVHGAPVDGHALAQRLADSLAAPYQVGSRELRVGCSIGLATSRRGDTPHDLLQRADQAMYADKVARRATR